MLVYVGQGHNVFDAEINQVHYQKEKTWQQQR